LEVGAISEQEREATAAPAVRAAPVVFGLHSGFVGWPDREAAEAALLRVSGWRADADLALAHALAESFTGGQTPAPGELIAGAASSRRNEPSRQNQEVRRVVTSDGGHAWVYAAEGGGR
jgi:hypothetical protein